MIILISGVQGAGKTTIIHEILKKCPDYKLSISATTRPKRTNEFINEYEFLTLEEFNKKEKENYFLEVIEFNNYKYGTPLHELNNNIILNVNPSSILNFQYLFKKYNFKYKSIFIHTPMNIIEERLILRDSKDRIDEKIKKANEEMVYKKYFQYLVNNTILNKAIHEIFNIISEYKS